MSGECREAIKEELISTVAAVLNSAGCSRSIEIPVIPSGVGVLGADCIWSRGNAARILFAAAGDGLLLSFYQRLLQRYCLRRFHFDSAAPTGPCSGCWKWRLFCSVASACANGLSQARHSRRIRCCDPIGNQQCGADLHLAPGPSRFGKTFGRCPRARVRRHPVLAECPDAAKILERTCFR